MKTILIIILSLFIVSSQSVYGEEAEPKLVGSSIGDYPHSPKKRVGHPYSDAMWAGNIYLLRQKLEAVEFVVGAKLDLIKNALKAGKSLAKKRNRKYYAIEHIHFQVLHTDNKVEVYIDCDVLAFN